MMGAIAEAVRTWPGAIRSAHPQSSLTALGADAARLTADHPLDCHLGPSSPLGRLAADDRARILLLGVGYEVCTAFHLGEYRWSGNDLRDYECVITEAGRRHWYRYQDVRLIDSDFGRLGAALDAEADRYSVRRGPVAAADCRLLPFTAAVDFAAAWFELNRPSRAPQSPPPSPLENA
jgi:aminoglycoside 3-N-acetyltransferase